MDRGYSPPPKKKKKFSNPGEAGWGLLYLYITEPPNDQTADPPAPEPESVHAEPAVEEPEEQPNAETEASEPAPGTLANL
jgi:hypothetical protein